MIPNTDPELYAVFKNRSGGRSRIRVIAWSDIGAALVPNYAGHLQPANYDPGFVRIETYESPFCGNSGDDK